MDYLLHILTLISIYTLLSHSLSLVAGYSGQISIAHSGFYGIGAYTTAILSTYYDTSFFVSALIAIALAGFIAYLFAKVAEKTIDDYFIIITLGIQVVVYSVLNNWQSLTNGPLGIAGIPPIEFFGIELTSNWSIFLFSFLTCLTIWFFLRYLSKSIYGKVLRAISVDEVFVESLGKSASKYKVTSFTISGALGAIPGIIFAHYITFIDPSSFSIEESIFILSIVIVGGMRNFFGIFLASTFMVVLPEALRFIGVQSSFSSNLKQIIYGLLLVLVILKSRKKLKFQFHLPSCF